MRRLRTITACLLALCALGMLATAPESTRADAKCDLYAAPRGNDANEGTSDAPLKNPIRLLKKLAPGRTGCLKDGAVFEIQCGAAQTNAAGEAGRPKTLRPETPGATSEIRARCGFAFTEPSHDLVLRDLVLRKSGRSGGSMLQVNGDRITLDNLDLSHPGNICVDIGGDPRAGGNATDSSNDVVIRNSRVHHCGSAYGAPRTPIDSGVHGIYAQFTRRLLIEDNLIYANHNRGIQLYPDADDTIIRRNVLHGNGANLNLGSEGNEAIYSTGSLTENNILTDSVLSGLEPGGFVDDRSEVLGNFPPPGPDGSDFNNRVERNCIANATHPTELYEGHGFTIAGNVENQDPGYANPDVGIFALNADSPCLGKGPRWIQPNEIAPDEAGFSTAPETVKLRSLRARGLAVRFACKRGCAFSWRLQLRARVARRFGLAAGGARAPVIVGRAWLRRTGAVKGRFRVQLTSKARRRLAPAQQLTLALRTRVREPGTANRWRLPTETVKVHAT
jgi:hypothetical protein